MGSGPSKEDKKPQPARDSKRDNKPVANVNNHGTLAHKNSESVAPQSQPVQKTFITQPDESIVERNNRINNHGSEQSQRHDDPNSDVRGRARTKQQQDSFVWKADKETEDELSEVLRVPTDNNNRETSRTGTSVSPVRQQDLPETYAQRKQREQYTLNQQMLLRQKTIYRNPDDWKNEDDEEEHAGKGGFDPSKFRSANKGQPVKSTVFSTNMKQDGNIQYMSGRQNMDEFDVSPRQQEGPRDLPVYNQSEQDLMASLERELMG
ncbi:uncharacterized protein LOC143290835 [Babylonia areolata]|uniref:uncharacterized protein LOC143290835 n=1 Tax=Babylonia areolata TaxID=304850 RepID=UPI003FD595FF